MAPGLSESPLDGLLRQLRAEVVILASRLRRHLAGHAGDLVKQVAWKHVEAVFKHGS